MKSKNIPADIKVKSIKDAQVEIKEIIEKLENIETNLENSRALYERMMKLNLHIQDKFRQITHEINQTTLKKSSKKLLKS
ncbi:exodeoxyribonuclease VII small subunit [Pelagibacteraceae bacterium]|jgi:exonuclease VII small subunit|nr:exodeoxyribonuclease VII small subunit [Pelagibacteraceae bacterium]